MLQSVLKLEPDLYHVRAKYTESLDLVIVVGKGGGNSLPDIRCVYAVSNAGQYSADTPHRYEILNHSTDLIGPNIVRAVQCGDGDHPELRYFTGGNHQSNNRGYGGNVTARCVSFSCKCDGQPVDAEGCGSDVCFSWTNYLQGYNTTRDSGTGREILREDIQMRIRGTKVYVEIYHTALEDIVRETYYGLQMASAGFSGVSYVGGDNPGWHPVRTMTTSNDRQCRLMSLRNHTSDCIDIGIDQNGLGTFSHNEADHSAFNMQYGKCYFNLIRDKDFFQNKSEVTVTSGYYYFYSNLKGDIYNGKQACLHR